MKKNHFVKAALTTAGIASLLFMAQAGAANKEELVDVQINGVPVQSSANQYIKGNVYVDAKSYSKTLGLGSSIDNKQKTFSINKVKLQTTTKNGTLLVKLGDIVKATGGEKITVDSKNKLVYVLDLPEGTVKITDAVPGMGEHWANPKDMPVGPIYGVYEGKLIFLEQMLLQDDFIKGTSWQNIQGMKGLPSPSVNHTDIEFQPNGHEGLEFKHYDLHHYFIDHSEHLKIPAASGTHSHK